MNQSIKMLQLTLKLRYLTTKQNYDNIIPHKRGIFIMEKILESKLKIKKDRILQEKNNLPNNSYNKQIKNAELSTLERLNGLEEYLYLARLIQSDIESYRKVLISEIYNKINDINSQIIHLEIENAKLKLMENMLTPQLSSLR